jgi:hypothetical protein
LLRRAAPAALVVLLIVAALTALANLRGGADDLPAGDAGAEPPVVGSDARADPGDDGPPVPAGGRAVTLPRGGAAELGEALYEILGATLAPHAAGSTLTLRVRLTNAGRYGMAFGRGDFRLVHGDRTDAPTNDLSEVVEAQTTRDGELTFEVPDDARSATLRIMLGTETADVPLDLTGRAGPTAERARQARSRGADRFDVAVPAARSTMRFGEFALTVRAARLRRYANKLELSLDVRADNASRYAAALGDGEFRLLVDGLARAPVSGVGEVVAAASSKEVTILFDLPFGTRDVVLRTLVGDATAELPLRLPDVD